jgi:nucleotide-binding universal stress UspA family protein
MKKFLVPTGFSAEADKALEIAASLAQKFQADVHFLNVIEPLTGDNMTLTGGVDSQSMDSLFIMKLMERNQKEVEKRANKSIFMGLNTTATVHVNEIFTEIKEFSTTNAIDLVVMGSKGSSGLSELLVGSNAERMTRNSSTPVLIVKKSVENFEPKNIVFATNGEDGAKVVVEALNKFQSAFGCTVHVLNVNTPNNFYRSRTMEKMLRDFVEASGLQNFTINIYNDANEEDGILNFAEDVKADMIAIGTHARTGFSRILSSNISEDVVNHSNLPVLTVKI